MSMGQPEMEALWQDLSTRKQAGGLGKDGITLRHCLTHAAGLNKVEPGRVGYAARNHSDRSAQRGDRPGVRRAGTPRRRRGLLRINFYPLTILGGMRIWRGTSGMPISLCMSWPASRSTAALATSSRR
jgi:hypothetical protein